MVLENECGKCSGEAQGCGDISAFVGGDFMQCSRGEAAMGKMVVDPRDPH